MTVGCMDQALFPLIAERSWPLSSVTVMLKSINSVAYICISLSVKEFSSLCESVENTFCYQKVL